MAHAGVPPTDSITGKLAAAPCHHLQRFRSIRHVENRAARLQAQASAQEATAIAERPPWAGGGLVTELVNLAIGCKPLYEVMKVMAKRELQSTAQRRGIAWQDNVRHLQSQQQELEQIKQQIEDKTMHYPDYYLRPFHAYPNGNLEWMAAFEAEPATEVIYLNCWKQEKTLALDTARQRMRGSVTDAIKEYQQQHGALEPQTVLDVGCSVGVSTRWLAAAFPQSTITGLDLSPYFLAVAELRQRQSETVERPRIKYMHARGESTGLPPASQDLVTLNFIIHECPPEAIQGLVKEARRLLRPDGILMVTDMNPRSAVIQNLPPPIFTLMKSTEPWSDTYYTFDLEGCLAEQGFGSITTLETDPRHRAVLGLA